MLSIQAHRRLWEVWLGLDNRSQEVSTCAATYWKRSDRLFLFSERWLSNGQSQNSRSFTWYSWSSDLNVEPKYTIVSLHPRTCTEIHTFATIVWKKGKFLWSPVAYGTRVDVDTLSWNYRAIAADVVIAKLLLSMRLRFWFCALGTMPITARATVRWPSCQHIRTPTSSAWRNRLTTLVHVAPRGNSPRSRCCTSITSIKSCSRDYQAWSSRNVDAHSSRIIAREEQRRRGICEGSFNSFTVYY